MTTVQNISEQHAALTALRTYLVTVAEAVGVGSEAHTVDQDSPVSAYLALDSRLTSHPDRDLALLWDEESGWSAAVENRAEGDLITVSYLGGSTVVPPAQRVARFVQELSGLPVRSCSARPRLRAASTEEALRQLMTRHRR
ncbi:hypothetical protein D5S17_03880 [Pseudonocardiaceae bacterium YIM PH 21723]|nr:hypothetical protein D5S17_03880 [Pseudonocardiaceae bacterium YIM PH 21723]